jgi:hypothetical protein
MIPFQNGVKGADCFFIIALGKINVADPELRGWGERRFRVVLQIITEFLQGEIVFFRRAGLGLRFGTASRRTAAARSM